MTAERIEVYVELSDDVNDSDTRNYTEDILDVPASAWLNTM